MNGRAPGPFDKGVGGVQALPQSCVGRALRVAGAELDGYINRQDAGVAGGGQQPGGLAQHVVVLHHLGEAKVLEGALFMNNVVFKVHDQQGGVAGVQFQSHDVLHSPIGGASSFTLWIPAKAGMTGWVLRRVIG